MLRRASLAVAAALAVAVALAVGVAPLASCRQRAEVVVFHAASLRRVMSEAAEAFQRDNPGVMVRLEPSGSLVAARKVSELGLRADLVAVADVEVIDRMLVPRHAAWSLEVATNEIVLAHMDHSRYTDEISTENWPEVLLRPGVRLGRVDPALAPLGYQTLIVWQLAERPEAYGVEVAGLAARLAARVPVEHVAPDETELLALLEARAVEYAFLYRSTAEDHHLKVTALPPAVNLSRPELADGYASARVEIGLGPGRPTTTVAGHPIVYALAMPRNAPNPRGAERFAAFLVGERGRAIFTRAGFAPLSPPRSNAADALPAVLRGRVAPAP